MNDLEQIEHRLRGLLYEKATTAAPLIQTRAREILRAEINATPTVRSLRDGKLRAEFGLENPNAIDAIVDTWVESLSVRVEVKGGRISLVINTVQDLYLDVLFLPEAQQAIDGGELSWLRFLLLCGSHDIVVDYYVSKTNSYEAQYSRSNMETIMRKRAGAKWAVPTEFQGTLDNNFISRLCDQLEQTMAQLMMEELQK